MPKNSQKIGEANFKAAVFQEYFGTKKFTYMQEVDRIDFVITDKTDRHIIWAESKRNTASPVEMFVQLILTIGKGKTYDKHTPPPFLCVFDYEKIAFLQYHFFNEILYSNDFNWNVTPSDHKSKEFQIIKNIVEKTINENKLLFSFDTEKAVLKEFIKINIASKLSGNYESINQVPIEKNNFLPVYNRWLETVKPSIAIDWDIAKKGGIIDGDFYLADLLSMDNVSLKGRLLIVLQNNHYKFAKGEDEYGISLFGEIQFKDNQKAYNEFWIRYKRPPLETYWDYIIERRDLLVPQDIRERKGSFFTPQIWVQKSQEYLTKTFGENWQDEYYVWDCAAGTGNLLVGLTNKYNIWASTLDSQDIGVMKDRIKNGANLLETHVFQFDFLNDSFDKLPEGLKEIIDDTEKRKKLIIYINPPYAEASSAATVKGTGMNKAEVAKNSKTYDRLEDTLGKSIRELFVQFLSRIYLDIDGCIVAEFSKIKTLQSPNYKNFRNLFTAKLLRCFVVPAFTFDNVKGKFPIGFKIWDTGIKKRFKKVSSRIFDENGKKIGIKHFCSYDNKKMINDWLKQFIDDDTGEIAAMCCIGNDFQHSKYVNINHKKYLKGVGNAKGIAKFGITINNIIVSCIYYSVRHTISPVWYNDRDQFLYPNSAWENDRNFHYDCLIFTLFNNNIQSKYGINHWIPFTAQEAGAKDNFKSDFMSNFLRGKRFSREAKDVLKSGRELWKYYHSKISGHGNARLNASLYDIREFFQGRSAGGTMKQKSDDETYNALIKDLRQNLSALAEKIQPKVYEYGFLEG